MTEDGPRPRRTWSGMLTAYPEGRMPHVRVHDHPERMTLAFCQDCGGLTEIILTSPEDGYCLRCERQSRN